MGLQEKIREIEEEMKRTQKNKATEYHLGVLKAKIAQLRRELLMPKKGGASGGGFDVKKSGDATVAIIGLPSVGKSTLLNKITNAESKTAAYAFTTLTCIPGLMEYRNAKIQLLDLPGIIEGAHQGRGRGREVIAVARSADLLLVIVEARHPGQLNVILRELEGFGIRVNKTPPHIVFTKTHKGGIVIDHTVPLTRVTRSETLAALNEYGHFNANVIFRSDSTVDELIDVLEGNRVYLPAVFTANKVDEAPGVRLPPHFIPISAQTSYNLELLKSRLYNALHLIKVYTKRKGEEADLKEPLIIRAGSTVGDVCDRLHRDLRKEFKFALVWGRSVKHPAQRLGPDHVLQDGDIVQIVKK